jgi:hypothetical protein
MTKVSKAKSKQMVVDTEHAMVVVEAPPSKQNEGTGPVKVLKATPAKKAKPTSPEKKSAPKKSVAKQAKSMAERTTIAGFEPDQKIVVLAKENPGREGTKRHDWFATYMQKGMTVGRFVETVKESDRSNALGYLKNDVEKRKLIKVV